MLPLLESGHFNGGELLQNGSQSDVDAGHGSRGSRYLVVGSVKLYTSFEIIPAAQKYLALMNCLVQAADL